MRKILFLLTSNIHSGKSGAAQNYIYIEGADTCHSLLSVFCRVMIRGFLESTQ